MRVTKAKLLEVLEVAERFNQRELVFVGTSRAERIRSLTGFVPVECYGPGMFALPNEFGTCNTKRFLWRR